jgi:hypothetical protein
LTIVKKKNGKKMSVEAYLNRRMSMAGMVLVNGMPHHNPELVLTGINATPCIFLLSPLY